MVNLLALELLADGTADLRSSLQPVGLSYRVATAAIAITETACKTLIQAVGEALLLHCK